MDPSARMVGLDAQGNMVFTVVKPVMGIFQVSAEQTSGASQADMGLQELSGNALILPQAPGQAVLDQNREEMNLLPPQIPSQMQMCAPVESQATSQNQEVAASTNVNLQPNTQVPFAEVLSLLDPNMKGSKARKSPFESKVHYVKCSFIFILILLKDSLFCHHFVRVGGGQMSSKGENV